MCSPNRRLPSGFSGRGKAPSCWAWIGSPGTRSRRRSTPPAAKEHPLADDHRHDPSRVRHECRGLRPALSELASVDTTPKSPRGQCSNVRFGPNLRGVRRGHTTTQAAEKRAGNPKCVGLYPYSRDLDQPHSPSRRLFRSRRRYLSRLCRGGLCGLLGYRQPQRLPAGLAGPTDYLASRVPQNPR